MMSAENSEVGMTEVVNRRLKNRTKCGALRSWIYASRNLLGALIARIMFLIVALICTGIGVASTTFPTIYLLFVPLILCVLETVVMLKHRKNQEWKWGTPCIFAFLLCSVPAIWILEYQSYVNAMVKDNSTTKADCDGLNDLVGSADIISVNAVADMATKAHEWCICTECVPLLVQALLLVLIVGRWLLPKSKSITADQKAQLLLVNIAVAADILELFELLKEPNVLKEFGLVLSVLFVWSCSLLQFGIVSTATSNKGWMCFQSEMWALITLLCLDDLSFIILRIVCMAFFDVNSYNMYFFTAKNALVLMLDLNRIYALYHEMKKEKKSPHPQGTIRTTHLRR